MSRNWPAFIAEVKATPGEWFLAAEGAGTNRCRPIMGKGLQTQARRTSTSPVRFDIYAMAPVDTSAPPYRIMTLVELLSGSLMLSGGEPGEAVTKAVGWCEANPGRWFIVGHLTKLGAETVLEIGMDQATARNNGLEAETRNYTVYARTASPSGLPLDDFVTRRTFKRDPLPMLQRDRFDWTLHELRNAASTAREWLAGGVGYAAA